jgi:polyphosphate kinase
MSENIRVLSLVGRFLEHSRIYYFQNGDSPDVLIGSADAMRRNLDRRIEALVPVERPQLIEHIRHQVLQPCLDDTANAWDLAADGTYHHRTAPKPYDSQTWFIAHPATKAQFTSHPAELPHRGKRKAMNH